MSSLLDKNGIVILVHPSQRVNALKLGVPLLGVVDSILHVLVHKLIEVNSKDVVFREIFEVSELNVSDSLLLESLILFLRFLKFPSFEDLSFNLGCLSLA